jgi:hypothetical protein
MSSPKPGLRPFAEQFKDECRKRNLQLKDVAEQRLKKTPSYVTQLCTKYVLSQNIERLSDAIGVSPDVFDMYRTTKHYEAVKEGDPNALALADLMATLYRQRPRKAQAMLAAITELTHNFKED